MGILSAGVIKANRVITSIPVPVSAEVTSDDPDKVVITFDQLLNEASIPATTAFALAGKTISDVDVSGATVILTVTVAYDYGDTPTVNYSKPLTDMLKAVIGGASVASFVDLSITVHPEYEITQYITGLVTSLSGGQILLLNTFVKSLKTGLGISRLNEKFDIMHILAGETQESALRNIVKSEHTASAVGSPAFVALEGFTSIGNDSYVNTNFNPSTQGVKYTLNNASYGFYSRTARAGSSGVVSMGVISAGAYSMIFAFDVGGASSFGYLNNVAVSIYGAASDSLGMRCMSRSGLNDMGIHVNKNHTNNSTRVSSSIPIGNFYVGARNNNGTADAEDAIQMAFDFAGGNLSDAEIDILVDAFEAYMDSNGKGVL